MGKWGFLKKMSNEEIRTIYTMRYTFEHNDEIYMGWTSDPIDQVLEDHKRRAKEGEETLMYSRMRATGVDKWYIVSFGSGPTSVDRICLRYEAELKFSGFIPVTETDMDFLSKRVIKICKGKK